MIDYTKIRIVSGEGDGPGHNEPHTGRPTLRAVKQRLKLERCNGDRWAHAMIGYLHLDEDTGDLHA